MVSSEVVQVIALVVAEQDWAPEGIELYRWMEAYTPPPWQVHLPPVYNLRHPEALPAVTIVAVNPTHEVYFAVQGDLFLMVLGWNKDERVVVYRVTPGGPDRG